MATMGENFQLLFNQAQDAFFAMDYSGALAKLKEIGVDERVDKRLHQNKAVASYFVSSLDNSNHVTTTRQLLEELKAIYLAKDTDGEGAHYFYLGYNIAIVSAQLRQYEGIIDVFLPHPEAVLDLDASEDDFKYKYLFISLDILLSLFKFDEASKIIELLDRIRPSGEEATHDMSVNQHYVHMYKLIFALATDSLKTCKKEVKILNASPHTKGVVQFVKGFVEYRRRYFKKAQRLLLTTPLSVVGIDEHLYSLFYHNNMGCLYFQTGSYVLSMTNFENAYEHHRAYTAIRDARGIKEGVFMNEEWCYEILYNNALACLFHGDHVKAYQLFTHVYANTRFSSRLLIRMAECAIRSHAKGLESQRVFSCFAHLGKGARRHLVSVPPSPPNQEEHILSLSRALSHLNAALSQLLSLKNNTRIEEDPVPLLSHYAPLSSHQTAILVCTTRASLAYVLLHLDNPIAAHEHAVFLIEDLHSSPYHRYLGRLYGAMALVALGKTEQAESLLEPHHVDDAPLLSFPSASSSFYDMHSGDEHREIPAPPFLPSTLAKGLAAYNLAVLHARRGVLAQAAIAYNKAVLLLDQTSHTHHVVILGSYIALRMGNTLAALRMLQSSHPLPLS